MTPDGLLGVAAVALLLGARHATEPDHLTAVATLAVEPPVPSFGRLAWLGLAWGAGHGGTLLLLGVPAVLLGGRLPAVAAAAAESLVGVLIAALAVRLLLRWRRGYLHLHPHRHQGRWHAHPHVHELAPASDHPAEHTHRHRGTIASPRAAFGLGLVHGIGGSAGAGVVLVASRPDAFAALVALVLFALSATLAMVLVTAIVGSLLGRWSPAGTLERALPAFGIFGFGFGVYYALQAWSA